MDLRQLRYLIAVADELNFTRAAERCHVSQPPLSRAIGALEAEVGALLVERDTHRVVLTPAGLSLVEDARRLMEGLGEGFDRAQRIAKGLAGRLEIGFGGSTVYSLLPLLVRRFRAAVPGVELRFHAMPVPEQIDALRDGRIDIGLVRLPIHDELVETRYVRREAVVVALPFDHPLAAEPRPVAMFELAGEAFVAYQPRRGFGYHADLLALCRLAGFDPRLAHEVPTTEAIIGLVACGEGIAIVPASARRLQMRGVVFRRVARGNNPARLLQVEFALAWRREQPKPTVIEFVRASTNRSA